jgi:ABC-type uncharacterized transport system permease subunit
MSRSLLFNLTTLLALVPATLTHFFPRNRRDVVFWSALGVAAAGSIAWAATLLADQWHTGLSVALWLSIAASLVVFIVLSMMSSQAWRLLPLLMPYLLLLGIVATVWSQAPERPLPDAAASGWLDVHIFVSVLTYALLTIAAVAGSSVLLQEWALKRKRPTGLTRALPSVTDGEKLQLGLLAAGAVVLGVGLITGAATQYVENGTFVVFDHKTLLSVLAFVVIGLLLIAHRRTGVRGRRAARFVLLAYLLLTLAYPGVKFVTNVLMA